jgi:hypothetical protein
MAIALGLLALLEAKPGKGDELAAFLEAGRELALAEDGTVTWYAFKLGDTTYGIFDTFESSAGLRGAPGRRDPEGVGPGGAGPLGAGAGHPDGRRDRCQVARGRSASARRTACQAVRPDP